MVTAYVRRDTVVKNGQRIRTYKDTTPPSTTGGYQTFRSYFASSNSVTNGDHSKPNPFYFCKALCTSVGYDAVQTDPNSNYNTERGFASLLDQVSEGTSYGTSQETVAYNEALSELSSKIRGDVDWSINLFQWRQLTSLLNRIRNLTSTYASTKLKLSQGWGPGSKELAGLYLEYIYGLRPLMTDLYNTFDMLVTEAKSGGTLYHFRGRGKSVETFSEAAKIVAFSAQNCPVRIIHERSVRCQLDVYLKPGLTGLQKLGNYTSLNPVSWAWELLPYSFVVDWFVDFGGYLRVLETALLYNSSFAMGCKTQTIRHDYSVAGSGMSGKVSYAVNSGSRVIKYYDRSTLASMPTPDRPVIKLGLSPWRIVNAVALLLQQQPKPKRKPRTGKPRALRPLGQVRFS